MSSSDLAISIRGLSKSYTIAHGALKRPSFREVCMERLRHPFRRPETETFWALKDVSLDVNKGEVVGIIGRNGAGKSTLLKILSRITEPTTGEIDLNGRVGSLLEVGTGFHPELTGRENIFLNGAILGMTRAEIHKHFEAIVDFSEIDRFLDTPVKRYSSGMYVRLAFAVAAHLSSEVLVVDEVLAVGDAQFQKKCLGKMGDVVSAGRAVLFVSHNLSAVSSLCNRVVVLDSGRAVFEGPTQQGVDRYTMAGATNASVDLRDEKDRHGRGESGRCWRISLRDSSGRPSDHFPMGDPVNVEIEIGCHRRLFPAEVGFSVENSLGTPIHYFVSAWEGLELDLQPGRHIFQVRIPKLLVFPGTYALSVWLKRQGAPVDDEVDSAISLTVVGADVTGYGPYFERYTQSRSEVYCPSSWACTASVTLPS